MWIAVTHQDQPTHTFDRHYAIACPHCGAHSNVTAVSIPRYAYLQRFQPKRVVIGYQCDSCNDGIALRFYPMYDFGNNRVHLSGEFEELERPKESFEFKYLPEPVRADFQEALDCYSVGCLNAFAAMCRRCVQSAAGDLGANGTDKVIGQLKDLKDTAQIDDEMFLVLKQVIIDGHDGAHPHLPSMSRARAGVLLELMKDVLYQLFVRRGKLQEAMQLRGETIKAQS